MNVIKKLLAAALLSYLKAHPEHVFLITRTAASIQMTQ
jgi:hypothetical protein